MRASFDRVVYESLPATAFALVALYMAYAIGHGLSWPSAAAGIMIGLTILAAGLFFLSWRWLAATAATAWLGWAAVAHAAAPSGDWQYFGFALVVATGLAVLVHAARLRAFRRAEILRVSDRTRHEALLESAFALQQSEQRYRDLVENGLGIIATHDPSGTLSTLNPAGSRALGYESEELLGRSLRRVLAPRFAPLLDAYLERILGERRDHGIMRVVTSSGEERLWAYHSVLCQRNEQPPHVLVNAYDITDHIRLAGKLRAARAELEERVLERTRALRETNSALRAEVDERRGIAERLARYAQAMETCSDGIVLLQLDGKIVDANASLLVMCGACDKATLVGRNVLEILTPEDRDRARADHRDVLAKGALNGREYRLLAPGGARLALEVTIGIIAGDDGTPLGVAAVGRDVSERKRMETALRHSETYLRTLIENSADTILVLDADGTILAQPNGDNSTLRHFGHPQATVLGCFASDFVHPDDLRVVARAFRAAITRPGEMRTVEFRVRLGDDSWCAAEAAFRNLLHDPTVAGLMCTVRDLSARKRAEEELRRAKEAAEAASQAKSEFLATISHELRTPLHAILGYAELLRDEAFGPLAPGQAEALRRIHHRAQDQFELISAVLDLGAIEANRMIVEPQQVRLAEVFDELAIEARENWHASSLILTWRAEPDLPSIETDRGKIKLILRNLVGNAFKFTTRGTITVDARRDGDGVELCVTDTGIGIPADSLDLIFEPFRQLDGSESRRYEGSGLGLHIVKRLVTLLQGSIAVESAVGRGSVFRVRLPVRPAGSALVVPFAPSRRPSGVRDATGRGAERANTDNR